MTRRIIEGTETNPITVRPADLPRNADFSYLRHVRLTGTWGSTRSLRWLDIRQSQCNADISRADITGIDSMRTDWSGATLSENQELANVCSFDFRHAITSNLMRAYQGWGKTPSQVENMISILQSEENRNEVTPRRLITVGAQALGLTYAEARQHILTMYSPKLHLLQRIMKQSTDRDRSVTSHGLRIWRLDPDDDGFTDIPVSQFTQPMRDAIARRDRWQLARAAEDFGTVPLVAHCIHLRPDLELVAAPRAMFQNPKRYRCEIEGNTPAQRIRTLLSEPNWLFMPRVC